MYASTLLLTCHIIKCQAYTNQRRFCTDIYPDSEYQYNTCCHQNNPGHCMLLQAQHTAKKTSCVT